MSEATASQTLAAWVTALRYSDIDAPTVAYAKELVLDHLGCAVRGATVDTADAVERMLASIGADEGAVLTAVVGGVPLRPEWAVFANGVHAHSIELDDTHSASSLHPAVVTIPAALATAELQGSSGRGAACGDHRRLRGGRPARARARSRAGLREGLPPNRDRRAVRGRGRYGKAARPLTGPARTRVRHRREPGGGAPRILLRRRVDQAVPSRLGIAQRLSRRAARQAGFTGPLLGSRGATDCSPATAPAIARTS